MWCDIKDSKYAKDLAEKIGEENTKKFSIAAEHPKFQEWFGNGKVVKLENGQTMPFVNPLMQVINEKGKTFNILRIFPFKDLGELDKFIMSYKGIEKREGSYYSIASADKSQTLILSKLFDELDNVYPGVVHRITSFQYSISEAEAKDENIHPKVKTLLDKLSDRFNIPYRIVYAPRQVWTGRFTGGQIEINSAKLQSTEIPLHEFLHPFINVLQKENPALYNALINELYTTKDGLETIGRVEMLYQNLDGNAQKEEALVTYLGKLAQTKYDNKPTSLVSRFINWLRSIFKKINIRMDDLSLNTKLSDIADMITDDVYVADLKESIESSRVLSQEYRADTDLTYENIFGRVKDKISILQATVKNRKQGDAFKEDINELHDILSHSDEITSLNNFVSNAVAYVDAAHKRFESLRDSVKDTSKLSKDELSYNMHILSEIQQLLNVYESLDDIKSLYVREGLTSENDVMARLRDAIDKKDLMVEDFKNFALSYLTEWLFPYLEPTNKNLKAQGYESKMISKDQFRDQLKTALRDISAAGFWLGSSINSRDPISAAVGLALKDIVYENHVKDLQTKQELEEEYKKVRGTAVYTTKSGEEEFNLQFLKEIEVNEQIGVDAEGNPQYGYVKHLAFHTEYNDDQFDKARREFYNSIGERPKLSNKAAYQKWQKAVGKWYNENTQVLADANVVVQRKREQLTKRQFERWILDNTKEIDEEIYDSGMKKSDFFGKKVYSANLKRMTFRIYSGELIRPAEKYRNKQFNIMMSNHYYRALYNSYKQANEKLGQYGLKYGMIPQVSKGKNMFSDLKWNKGVKENLKTLRGNVASKFKANHEDSRTVQRQDGTEVKHIPIKYTKSLEREDLNTNLLDNVLKFTQMANNYEGMTEIEPNILVLKTVLNGDINLGIKGREITKTNAKGESIINSITKRIVPKMAKEDMLDARLNEFINDVVYGDEEFEHVEKIPLIGEVSMNKLGGHLGFITSLQNMALNFTGGINNVVVGNFNNAIEAVGGRFWGKVDWLWAHKEYFANIHQFLGEIAGMGESDLNHMAEHYSVPQGEFQDQFGNNVAGGQVNKLLKTSSLFFLQKGGEHEIQITGLLSLMHATKVTGKNGESTNLYAAWKKSNSDFNKLKETYNWTDQDDVAFRNRLHAITKSLQGIYNKFDKAMLQRRWYGKLALMFRKYIFSSFRARYGEEYVDYELGTTQEGYWRGFVNKMVSEVKDYKWAMLRRMWTKEGYSEQEKAAFKKTVFELGLILAAAILAGMTSRPDKDKKWVDNEVALQLTRMSADITQYINPVDFIRVIRNPAASINTIEKYASWLSQFGSPSQVYKRKAGIAKKGDNMLYIKTLKLMPVIRQVINFMTPEEQIKFYNLTSKQ
jgi:hypothetical protein